jgi:hypothetical protein
MPSKKDEKLSFTHHHFPTTHNKRNHPFATGKKKRKTGKTDIFHKKYSIRAVVPCIL